MGSIPADLWERERLYRRLVCVCVHEDNIVPHYGVLSPSLLAVLGIKGGQEASVAGTHLRKSACWGMCNVLNPFHLGKDGIFVISLCRPHHAHFMYLGRSPRVFLMVLFVYHRVQFEVSSLTSSVDSLPKVSPMPLFFKKTFITVYTIMLLPFSHSCG